MLIVHSILSQYLVQRIPSNFSSTNGNLGGGWWGGRVHTWRLHYPLPKLIYNNNSSYILHITYCKTATETGKKSTKAIKQFSSTARIKSPASRH